MNEDISPSPSLPIVKTSALQNDEAKLALTEADIESIIGKAIAKEHESKEVSTLQHRVTYLRLVIAKLTWKAKAETLAIMILLIALAFGIVQVLGDTVKVFSDTMTEYVKEALLLLLADRIARLLYSVWHEATSVKTLRKEDKEG